MRKIELLPRHHWIIFFKRVDRIESSKEQEHVPSMSGMSEIAACPQLLWLMIFQLYHFPPPLPPPISNSSCLFTRCPPLYSSCCTVLLCFSRYYTMGLKIFSLFFVFVCFLCIICVKSIINLLQYSTM